MIQDSGNRREFDSGAVRDIQEGKGRCDLLPLGILAEILDDSVLDCINEFTVTNAPVHIHYAIKLFVYMHEWDIYTSCLEVAKHYEEGAKKYDERNWEKGIPCHCYIDSGVRHYLKFKRGDNDEPHDRAFIWNMLGLLWTLENKPEFNDLEKHLTND